MNYSAADVWKYVCGELIKTGDVSTALYQVYIEKLEPIDIKNSTLILSADNKKRRAVVETDYKNLLLKHMAKKYQGLTQITILSKEQADKYLIDKKNSDFITPSNSASIFSQEYAEKNPFIFNKGYTFNTFVEGSSNFAASKAAKRVADQVIHGGGGAIMNPLFIHGNVGLGKTHLLHAIGNRILDKSENKKVLFSTTEQFLSDFINSLQPLNEDERKRKINKTEVFKNKYRNVDILLIDDIQFLKGKPSTVEALTFLFTDLYTMGIPVVFSSDREPNHLDFLHERLKSRFLGGLTIEIAPPNYELRFAILKNICMRHNYFISDEALSYIAEQCDVNIRELEGQFNNIYFYAKLGDVKDINVEFISNILKSNSNQSGALTSDAIVEKTCDYFKIDKSGVLGLSKKSIYARPRQVSIYLIKNHLLCTYAEIGDLFSKRTHSSIYKYYEKCTDLLKADKQMKKDLQEVESYLGIGSKKK